MNENLPFALDASARTYLSSSMTRLSQVANFAITLDSLLRRWESLVQQVELGYGDSIYEYTNDVAVRDLLESIYRDAPPSLRSNLMTYLEPLDQRFLLSTNEVLLGMVNPGGEVGSAWSNRIPKSPQGELVIDLRDAGFLP